MAAPALCMHPAVLDPGACFAPGRPQVPPYIMLHIVDTDAIAVAADHEGA